MAKGGRTAEAERALARYEEYARKSAPNQLFRLRVYIGTGQRDQAVALLEKAFSEHSSLLTTIKTDPTYDPLRSDPRFHELQRRVGLAQ